MKDDYYTYPDIDDESDDIESGTDLTGFDDVVDIASSSPEPPESSSDTPFRVTLGKDDSMSSRRPTSRPVGYRPTVPFNPPSNQANPPLSRTPTGRRMSDVNTTRPVQQDNIRQNPPPQYSVRENNSAQKPVQHTADISHQTQRAKEPQRSVSRMPKGQTQNASRFEKDNSYSDNRGRSLNSSSKSASGNKAKKIIVSLICIILVLVLAVGGYGMFLLGKINYDTSTRGKNEYISASELAHSGSVQNILIIGSDARGDVDGMRSDTMILASIDKKNHQLKLTSFLRDCLVYIPEKQSWNKLNAAFSFGGAKMVIDTIEYNFKVKIDSYVIIDFEIFTEFINAIGGVDVDGITEAEVNWLKANVQGININPGKSHLTGGAALWYCRVRKIDSDFKRTERQRKVVGAVINQVKHTNPVKTFNAIKKVLPMITTDIGSSSLMSLGINAIIRYMHYDMFQMQIPADGTWWNKTYSIGAVLEMDISKNTEKLKDFVFNKQVKE